MMKPLLFTAAALALAAGVASAQDLSRPDSSFAPKPKAGNWQNTVERTERGHLIGNPEAKTTLVEFISYTCPHCADFAARGEPALDVVLLGPGKIRTEVRPVIRNGLDLAVTLLANCGDPAQFKVRHRTLILAQADWLDKARLAPQSQQAIWQRGDRAGRQNAASALGLTAMLAAKGQSKAELDACIANDAAAQKLLRNDEADAAEFGVTSTPSFAMDGKLLAEVHSWEALYPLLRDRFTAKAD
ncbi:thioredoxin domain-containing protein [Erythrobacter oryzae]|uniref:thioredoxin domain-containing protein n=1 Tax=Erythrobacter oryzae TaxID=3019556 RepID=UPI00255506A6|nr:thioredoxin domain-containing protein [Erythrobacter sp. COR-2]